MENKARLAFGILIISWSSILIRWMGAVDPLIITFYRLSISALVLFPFVIREKKIVNRPANSHFLLILLAGFFLALHFYTWITSLQLTSVGNSIFLESTHPLFAYILSLIFLKERGSKSLLPALLLGLAGMYFTISEDMRQNQGALLGDGLAVFSAFCIAAYLLIARKLKQDLPLLRYLFYVYSTAALFTLGLLIWYQINFWQLQPSVWFLLFLLAIGPNLTGHSLLNWASRRMPVFLVNMALLSESVLATIYAALLLNEIPPVSFYFGAFLILASIIVVFRKESINISEA